MPMPRTFAGKVYQGPYRWFRFRREAEKEAETMRGQGMMVRIIKMDWWTFRGTKEGKNLPGYTLYLYSKERNKR